MAKTDITFKIDTHLLKKIKILAAQRETSISALITALLEEKLEKDLDYEQAKQRVLARLEKGYDLGSQPLPRDKPNTLSRARRYEYLGVKRLALVPEHFYVFRAFLYRPSCAALHLYSDLLDDIRIGERGDVACIHLIGNGG